MMTSRNSKIPCSKTQVWNVKIKHDWQRVFLKSLDSVGAVNIWSEKNSSMDFTVQSERQKEVARIMAKKACDYNVVAVVDLELNLSTDRLGPSSSCRKFRKLTGRTMNWTKYHKLEVIYRFLHNLESTFPYLCEVIVIGISSEGRHIKMLKICNGNPENTSIWVDGAIHAREWISAAVVTYIADQIVRNYRNQPDSVINRNWCLVPVLNPDGYEYTHTVDRLWRKNRSQYGEYIGVDLNRNFSEGWGVRDEEGSSEDPGSIFYRGPGPFSEPESRAVRDTILESESPFDVFLSLHSYGEVILFPWGHTSLPCSDYTKLLEGGLIMAKGIHETSGRTYKVGGTKDIMYYASGTSIDWSYGYAGIPYSYMIELRDNKHRFLLPYPDIIPNAQEVLNGILKLLIHIDTRSQSHSNSHSVF